MVLRGNTCPTKIKPDAIVEALLEIRFDEPHIPEVFYGKVIENWAKDGWQPRRLPAHAIPQVMRDQDEQLKLVPLFEVVSPDGFQAVRIGPRLMSFHRKAPYPGWTDFRPFLGRGIDTLFDAFGADTQPTVTRLGLKYMNGLTAEGHGIRSLADLDLDVVIGTEATRDGINLNYLIEPTPTTEAIVRVATPRFVSGPVPKGMTVYIDVDVYTRKDFKAGTREEVNNWLDDAHGIEKGEFFHLLRQDTIDRLKVDK